MLGALFAQREDHPRTRLALYLQVYLRHICWKLVPCTSLCPFFAVRRAVCAAVTSMMPEIGLDLGRHFVIHVRNRTGLHHPLRVLVLDYGPIDQSFTAYFLRFLPRSAHTCFWQAQALSSLISFGPTNWRRMIITLSPPNRYIS